MDEFKGSQNYELYLRNLTIQKVKDTIDANQWVGKICSFVNTEILPLYTSYENSYCLFISAIVIHCSKRRISDFWNH